MKRFYIIGFLILMLFDTLGQFGFKLAAMHGGDASFDLSWVVRIFSDKWIYLSLCDYLGAFFTYMTLLQHAPIGPAFAASHLEIVTVLGLSVVFLGESLSAAQIAGSVLIILGIVVLGCGDGTKDVKEALRGETSDAHSA